MKREVFSDPYTEAIASAINEQNASIKYTLVKAQAEKVEKTMKVEKLQRAIINIIKNISNFFCS